MDLMPDDFNIDDNNLRNTKLDDIEAIRKLIPRIQLLIGDCWYMIVPEETEKYITGHG